MIAPAAQPLPRDDLLARLRDRMRWDAVVIGGGATGLGIALDAAARGLRVALIEQRDFASGTSSRSSKLIHGGVRYLAQGNIALVREALAERAVLARIAPGLVSPLEFVVPCYRLGERAALRAGLGLYDRLAGSASLGATRWLDRHETAQRLPGVRQRGLRGGVSYWDAQFDDAGMAIALMQTACALGAVAVNYIRCERMISHGGRIASVVARDAETGERFELTAGCVFNAAGPWVDAVRAIGAGEELTYDYWLTRDPDDPTDRDRVYACHCGSPKCRGTMLGAQPKPKKVAKKTAKTKRVENKRRQKA